MAAAFGTDRIRVFSFYPSDGADIREQHQDLPDASNPYYTTKARMILGGLPKPAIEVHLKTGQRS